MLYLLDVLALLLLCNDLCLYLLFLNISIAILNIFGYCFLKCVFIAFHSQSMYTFKAKVILCMSIVNVFGQIEPVIFVYFGTRQMFETCVWEWEVVPLSENSEIGVLAWLPPQVRL